MTFKQYQKKALSTALYDSSTKAILCSVLGLMGEFTEFTENPVMEEMGDVWWYLAVLSYHLNILPNYSEKKKGEKINVSATIGKIQEIIKKSYRDTNLSDFTPKQIYMLHNLFDDLYTSLYTWSMIVVKNTRPEGCAEIIWELNIQKLQDRKNRNVLCGSGDYR